MARTRKPRRKTPGVSLPPFPWDTTAPLPGGDKTVPLARAKIEQGHVDLDCELSPDGEVVARRARVWRTATPPFLRNLGANARAAMLDYAEAVEALGASGGSSIPDGPGGGCPGTVSPSHRALLAAERLRRMQAALKDGELVVPVKDAKRLRRWQDGMARVPMATLADWVVIDGLSRSEILTRAGAAPSNEQAQDMAVLAVAEMGERLAICCGYQAPPTESEKKRNTPGA